MACSSTRTVTAAAIEEGDLAEEIAAPEAGEVQNFAADRKLDPHTAFSAGVLLAWVFGKLLNARKESAAL